MISTSEVTASVSTLF